MKTNTNTNTTIEIVEQEKLDKAFLYRRDPRFFYENTLKSFSYGDVEIYIASYSVPGHGEYYSVDVFYGTDQIYAFWEDDSESKVIGHAKKWVDEIKDGIYAEEEEGFYQGKISSFLVKVGNVFLYKSAAYDDFGKVIEGTEFSSATRKEALHKTKDALYQKTFKPKPKPELKVSFFSKIADLFKTLVHAHL